MFKKVVLLIVALAVAVTACSTDISTDLAPPDQPATPQTSVTTSAISPSSPSVTVPPVVDGFPVTIEADNGPVTIDERPERIVSFSPTSTEILFAIGAGAQVVAADDQSNYPHDVPTTELSSWQPNVEAIAEFEPDLVFISFDPGDVIAGLEAIGITVVLHGPASDVNTAFAQWEQTGDASGHPAKAEALVVETQIRLDDARTNLPANVGELSYYYELDDLYFTATSASFIGDLLSITGLHNVADAAPDPDGFGYPQLSTEFIVDADPSLILLADTKCCGQNAETIAERPGWDTLTALASGGVVELDDDVASRWGPRIIELIEAVVDALRTVESVDA